MDIPFCSPARTPWQSSPSMLQAERAAVYKTFGTPDQQEGMAAFIEKHKPVFNQAK